MTDLVDESIWNLGVARHRLDFASAWIAPEGVGPSFTFEVATLAAQVLQER